MEVVLKILIICRNITMRVPPEFVQGQIYLITNTVNGKEYVGQTKTHQWRTSRNSWIPYGYLERFNQHVRNTKNYEKFGRCRALNSAMKKHGIDKFTIELLEECPIESLDELEIYFIKEFDTIAPNGYNLDSGGNKNKWASDETRAIQSNNMKEYYKTEKGKNFKKKHCEFLHTYNINNNDKKKVNKFLDRSIDRIKVSHSVNEKVVYIYIYCDGNNRRNKVRVKYNDLDDSAIGRIKNIVFALTDDMLKIESEDIPLT